jgi:hypothetical protein
MSNVTSSILDCENIQAELTTFFQNCGAAFQIRRSPFAEMLTSDANRSGIDIAVSPGDGKVKTYTLRYDQKVSVDSVDDLTQCGMLCEVDNTVGDKSVQYTIDPCEIIQYGESYDEQDFRYNCQSSTDYINRRLAIMMNAMEEKIMTKSAEEAILLQGNWASDVENVVGDVLQVDTRLSNNAIDPNWLIELDFAIQQTAYCTGVLIAGAPEFEKAGKLMNAGCCNGDGVDLLTLINQYGKAVAWDPYITGAFGSNDFSLMTQLGAMQLLTFTKGDSANFRTFTSRGADYELIPLISPRLGVPIDLTVSVKCGKINLIMSTTTKVVAMPLDMFPTSDVQSGVNYVNYLQAV